MDKSGKKQRTGKWGEERAAEYLIKLGYQIITRNFRGNFGEIDLIGMEGAVWCFIEVKTRRQERFGKGSDAITLQKKKHIIRAAYAFINEKGLHEAPLRFDVVSIDNGPNGYQFTLIRNAFMVMGET
jgi:putative endonuclease